MHSPSILLLLNLAIFANALPRSHDSAQAAFNNHRSLPDLRDASIVELQYGLRNGSFTGVELHQAYLSRARSASDLQSILEFNPHAGQQAADKDAIRKQARLEGPEAEESLGWLWGIPVLIKDNIVQADSEINSTAGSFSLVGAIHKRPSTMVRKLEEAGAIIMGRTNMDVFANCGRPDKARFNLTDDWVDLSWGWSPRKGQTLSPFHEKGNVCGSSGGSGVAAFLSLAPITLGTETGWSISCPSSRNNIVGLRPTTGLTSRTGVVPGFYLRDTIGPMVKSITDAALTLNIIAGPDPLDPLTMTAENPDLERRIDYGKALEEEGWMKGKRMGLLVGEGFWVKGNVTEMAKRTLDGVVKTDIQLEELGAEVVRDIGYNFTALTTGWTERNHLEEILSRNIVHRTTDDFFGDLLYSPNKIRDAEDLIEFYKTHPEETPDGRGLGCQSLYSSVIKSDPSPLNSTYLSALHNYTTHLLHHPQLDIQTNMNEQNLTALVGLFHPMKGNDGGGMISGVTAMLNLPSLTVPGGWWDEEGREEESRDERRYLYPLNNMPFGIQFVARRWDEHTLLKVGRAYEKAVGGPQVWREEGWKRVRDGVNVVSGWGKE